ncbi:unnamed protein product, partial [Cylicostephanus goldi]
TCHDDGTFATCECPKGFIGETCSETVGTSSTCDPNPCTNGGKCFADGSDNGFSCECAPGFEGPLCESQAAEWVPKVEELTTLSFSSFNTVTTTAVTTLGPVATSCLSCVHADKCVESTAGALCLCHQGYRGPHCDEKGEVCDTVKCPQSQTCRPLISIGDIHTRCGCPIGSTGPKCKESTVASLDENSLFIHQSPNVMIG